MQMAESASAFIRAHGGRPGPLRLAQVAGRLPVDDDDLGPGAEPEDRRHSAQEMFELFHGTSRVLTRFASNPGTHETAPP